MITPSSSTAGGGGPNVPQTADNSEIYSGGSAQNIKYYSGFNWASCIGKKSGELCQPTCKASTTALVAAGSSFTLACDSAGYIGYRNTDSAAATAWAAANGAQSVNSGHHAPNHHGTFGFWINFGDYPYTATTDGGINSGGSAANALQCFLSPCDATSGLVANNLVTNAGANVDYTPCEGGKTTGDICVPGCSSGFSTSYSSGVAANIINLECAHSNGAFNGATNVVCNANTCRSQAVNCGGAGDYGSTPCTDKRVFHSCDFLSSGSTCTATCPAGYTGNAAATGFKLACDPSDGGFNGNLETGLTACIPNVCEDVVASSKVAGINYDECKHGSGPRFASGRMCAPHCEQELGYTTNIPPDVEVANIPTAGTRYHVGDLIYIADTTFTSSSTGYLDVPPVILKVTSLTGTAANNAQGKLEGPIASVQVITPAHPYRGIAVGGAANAEQITPGDLVHNQVFTNLAGTVSAATAYAQDTAQTQNSDARFDLKLRRIIIVSGGTGWAPDDTFTLTDAQLGNGNAPDLVVKVKTAPSGVITELHFSDTNALAAISGGGKRKAGYYQNLVATRVGGSGGTMPTVSIIVPEMKELVCDVAAATPTQTNAFDFSGSISNTMTCEANYCTNVPKDGGSDDMDWSDCIGKKSGAVCTPVCKGGYSTTHTGTPMILACPGGWIDTTLWPDKTTCAVGTCNTNTMTNSIAGYNYISCNGLQSGQTCTPICPTGSTTLVTGSAITLACGISGGFSAQQSTPTSCFKNRCYANNPTNPQPGADYTSCRNKFSGDTCAPSCLAGFSNPTGTPTFVLDCASNGVWGATPTLVGTTQCVAGACVGGPTTVSKKANVDYATCNTQQSATTCIYACNAYSVLDTSISGTSFVLACTSGFYADTASASPCVGRTCTAGPIAATANADYTSCNRLRSGEQCYPTCNPGFKLVASQPAFTLECNGAGQYANPNVNHPICQPYLCSTSGTVAGNSALDYSDCRDKLSGQSCTPTCPIGYSCSGTISAIASLACDVNGGFSDSGNYGVNVDAKRCMKPNPLTAIPNVQYGHCTISTSFSGSYCTPTCMPGYTTIVAATPFKQACDTANDGTGMFDGTNTLVCRVLPGQTCAALGWTNIVNGVCGETDTKLGPGQTEVLHLSKTYDEAFAICRDAGVRLCTQVEIDQGSAKNTGTTTNNQFMGNSFVWTSNTCNGASSHTVANNQADGSFTCQINTQRYPVQCCTSAYSSGQTWTPVTPPPTPAPTPPPTPASIAGPTIQSTKTCAALQWAKVVNGVCAESDQGFNSGVADACYTTNVNAALGVCNTIGARLCTTAEINSGVTTGTGCNFDLSYIWTADTCTLRARTKRRSVGYVSAKGDGSGVTECLTAGADRPVRCCADQTTTSGRKTCSELGWTNIANNVCGESDIGSSSLCYTASFADAQGTCAAAGARLCTIDEIDAGATAQTGCSFDTQYAWTSTWCGLGPEGGKYYVGIGGGGSATTRKCKNPKKPYPVRCCSDVSLSGTTAAPATTTTTFPFLSVRKSCATLGWQVTGNACGESDKAFKKGLDKCFTNKNHPDAERKCLKLGARMCTQADIAAGVGKGTGCNFDSQFLWTSTSCGANSYIQAKGNGDGSTQCRAAKSKGPMRCCSDSTVRSNSVYIDTAVVHVDGKAGKAGKTGKASHYTQSSLKTGTEEEKLLGNRVRVWVNSLSNTATLVGGLIAVVVGLAALAVAHRQPSEAPADEMNPLVPDEKM